jgi:hypothetical protein
MPYLSRNLHSSYVQKLAYIPYQPPTPRTQDNLKLILNMYLVANEKALNQLNHSLITSSLWNTINDLFGLELTTILLDLTIKDPSFLDSRHAYTASNPPPPYPTLPHTQSTRLA